MVSHTIHALACQHFVNRMLSGTDKWMRINEKPAAVTSGDIGGDVGCDSGGGGMVVMAVAMLLVAIMVVVVALRSY